MLIFEGILEVNEEFIMEEASFSIMISWTFEVESWADGDIEPPIPPPEERAP